MDKDVISVIIPIYNAEGYLERCVNSIQKQSYRNIQIILIDDGSTDQSGKICENLAEQDSRVVYIRQSNAGPSAARNLGLSVASGEFLTFIDADDCLMDIEVYQQLIPILKKGSVDAIFFGARVVNENGDYISVIRAGNDEIISANQAIRAIINDNLTYGGGFPWNKIWRYNTQWTKFDRSLCVYEDKKWTVEQLLTIENVYLSSKIGYCYYERINSLSHSPRQEIERMTEGIVAYKAICEAIIKKKEFIEFSKEQYIKIIFFTLWYGIRHKNKELFGIVFQKYYSEIKSGYIDYRRTLTLKNKLKAFIIWVYGVLYCKIGKY